MKYFLKGSSLLTFLLLLSRHYHSLQGSFLSKYFLQNPYFNIILYTYSVFHNFVSPSKEVYSEMAHDNAKPFSVLHQVDDSWG